MNSDSVSPILSAAFDSLRLCRLFDRKRMTHLVTLRVVMLDVAGGSGNRLGCPPAGNVAT